MEDPLKAYNDVLKISGGESIDRDIYSLLKHIKENGDYAVNHDNLDILRRVKDAELLGLVTSYNGYDYNLVSITPEGLDVLDKYTRGNTSVDRYDIMGMPIYGEAVANEVPFSGNMYSTWTWTCPSCSKTYIAPTDAEFNDGAKDVRPDIEIHLRSHGYSNKKISDILSEDYRHEIRVDRIIGDYTSSVANEVPYAGLTKNSTLTWTCPSCLQQIPWSDETMWSIKDIENIASDHLKSHGYSNEEISDIIDIDFQHLFRMDRIVGEAVANKFNVGDYFIDDNNKYGKVLDILDEGDDYQFLDVQMTYGHRQKRSEFMKKVNPYDIGKEEKYAIDSSTGIFNEAVTNKFNVGDYFIDGNNKYGKVLDVLAEDDDYQFLEVQMTYGYRQRRSEFMKKVNPSDIGEEEKYAIDNSTGIFNEAVANEEDGTDFDSDGDIDSEDYLEAKDRAIKKSINEESYASEFTMKDFEQNEDMNDHTENALQLAKLYGTQDEINDMERIKAEHEYRGFSWGNPQDKIDEDRRYEIESKYWPRFHKSEWEQGRVYGESYDSKHMDYVDGKYFNEQTSGQVWDNLDEISREAVLRATNFTFKMYDTPIFSNKHKILDASSWELMNDSPESWKDLSETIDELYGSHMYSSTWDDVF